MDANTLAFKPFFTRLPGAAEMTLPWKILVSLVIAFFYMVLLLVVLDRQELFFEYKLWLLGAICGAALFSLYVATSAFHGLLPIFAEMDGGSGEAQAVINRILTDRAFVVTGMVFGILNTSLGYGFGIPVILRVDNDTALTLYLGFFLTGFFCGMAIWGIVGVVVVFNTLAPKFMNLFDYHDPDGCGGTHGLGTTLVVFGIVTLLVGVLISLCLTSIPWTNAQTNAWVQLLLWLWIVFPYLMAAIVVGIPAVAILQQLGQYKYVQRRYLNSAIQEANSALEHATDPERITTLREKVAGLREELKILHEMSISPIDRKTRFNLLAAILPNILGSSIAVSSLTRILEIPVA